MLYYCKKCGRIILFVLNKNDYICDCCGNVVDPVPNKYVECEDFIKDNLEEEFIEKYIKSSPEFDQYLFDHREEILAKKNAEFNRAMAIIDNAKAGKSVGKTTSVTCPYCKSTNTKKITNTSKAVHTALFGIFSISRNSKEWHCNNCGSDF